MRGFFFVVAGLTVALAAVPSQARAGAPSVYELRVSGLLTNAESGGGWISSALQRSMLDLGTLGGPRSDASDVNELGEVVGSSTPTATGHIHAYVWTQATGMTDLGTLPGHTSSGAVAINNRGHVVGSSLSTPGVPHSFIWSQAAGMTDLGLGPSQVLDINDRDQVLGRYLPGAARSFLWTAEEVIDLGTLRAAAINNRGQVVGVSPVVVGDTIEGRVFIWTLERGMTDIGTLGGPFISCAPEAINNHGQVAGNCYAPELNDQRAFFWSAQDGWTALATAPGITAAATDVNDRGEVVGVLNAPHMPARAFKWTADSGFVDLGNLGGRDGLGNTLAVAHGINNRGDVVGLSLATTGDNHGFLIRTPARSGTPIVQ